MKKPGKRLSLLVHLTPQQKQLLTDLHKERGASQAQILRDALERQYLTQDAPVQLRSLATSGPAAADAELLHQVKVCGLTAVLQSRRQLSEMEGGPLEAYLRTYLTGASPVIKPIQLFGLAHKSLFQKSSSIYGMLMECFAQPRPPAIHLSVLMLDPNCDAAGVRASVEHGDPAAPNGTDPAQEWTVSTDAGGEHHRPIAYAESFFFKDMLASLEGLSELKKQLDETKNKLDRQSSYQTGALLQVKLISFLPMVWALLTCDSLFVEAYHFGRSSDVEYECLGGHLPLLRFHPGSDYYGAYNRQFQFLWQDKSRVRPASLGVAPCEDLEGLVKDLRAQQRRATARPPRDRKPKVSKKSSHLGNTEAEGPHES